MSSRKEKKISFLIFFLGLLCTNSLLGNVRAVEETKLIQLTNNPDLEFYVTQITIQDLTIYGVLSTQNMTMSTQYHDFTRLYKLNPNFLFDYYLILKQNNMVLTTILVDRNVTYWDYQIKTDLLNRVYLVYTKYYFNETDKFPHRTVLIIKRFDGLLSTPINKTASIVQEVTKNNEIPFSPSFAINEIGNLVQVTYRSNIIYHDESTDTYYLGESIAYYETDFSSNTKYFLTNYPELIRVMIRSKSGLYYYLLNTQFSHFTPVIVMIEQENIMISYYQVENYPDKPSALRYIINKFKFHPQDYNWTKGVDGKKGFAETVVYNATVSSYSTSFSYLPNLASKQNGRYCFYFYVFPAESAYYQVTQVIVKDNNTRERTSSLPTYYNPNYSEVQRYFFQESSSEQNLIIVKQSPSIPVDIQLIRVLIIDFNTNKTKYYEINKFETFLFKPIFQDDQNSIIVLSVENNNEQYDVFLTRLSTPIFVEHPITPHHNITFTTDYFPSINAFQKLTFERIKGTVPSANPKKIVSFSSLSVLFSLSIINVITFMKRSSKKKR